MTENCPPHYRERAQTMLVRLKLGKGEDVCKTVSRSGTGCTSRAS